MKKKVLIIIIFCLIVGSIMVYFKTSASTAKLTTQSSENISHADKQAAAKEMDRFSKTVKALNEGWENIRLGDSYKRAGQYQKAIEAYKKAYDVDPGNRVMSGKILIEAYEKELMYDEAVIIADDILKNQPLAKKGIDDFTRIRERLVAAKTN